MRPQDKRYIMVGSLLSDGNDRIYRVTHFIFSEGVTYKYGEPVEDNVVHVDVYDQNNLNEVIGHMDFVHLNFVYPVPIQIEYLESVGFENSELNGRIVYRLNNVYFESTESVGGYYTLRRIGTNELHPVQYIHEVQIIAAREL